MVRVITSGAALPLGVPVGGYLDQPDLWLPCSNELPQKHKQQSYRSSARYEDDFTCESTVDAQPPATTLVYSIGHSVIVWVRLCVCLYVFVFFV